jgi:hypothetical protein
MKLQEIITAFTLPLGILALIGAITLGCENKEKVLEIEGPNGGGVEVERDRGTGAVEVDAHDADDKLIDIETKGGTSVEVGGGDGVKVETK